MKERFTDLASEKGLVGSLLVDQYGLIEISDMVKAEMFTSVVCGKVFKEILAFFEKNEETDLVLIYDSLIEKGNKIELDDLSDLTSYVNSSSIRSYANNIREAFFSRCMVKSLKENLTLIMSGGKVMDVVNRFDNEKDLLIEGFQTEQDAHISGSISSSLDIILLAKESGGLVGMDTGSEKINGHFGGWQTGRTITLAGRPGMGKTTAALGWALSAAETGDPVLLFSLEVGKEMTVMTLAAIKTGIDTDSMMKGELSDQELHRVHAAHEELSELPIYIIDNVYEIGEIVSKTRLYSKKHGVKLMILDYIQMAKGEVTKSGNRHQEIESIMKQLKKLTKKSDAGVCVLNLSQLNRSVELRAVKRPMSSDLKESGSIEEGSDIVLLMYRPAYYGVEEDEEGNSTKGVTELIVAKNKWGGTGTIFQKMANRRFTDIVDPDFDHTQKEDSLSKAKTKILKLETSDEDVNKIFGKGNTDNPQY